METVISRILMMSVAGSVVILLALILRRIFVKGPKWIPLVLWGIVALRLLCPLFVESRYFGLIPRMSELEEASAPKIVLTEAPPVSSSPVQTEAFAPAVTAAPSAAPAVTETAATEAAPAKSTDRPQSTPKPVPVAYARTGRDSGPAFFVWLAGVCAMTLYALVSYILLRRKLMTAVRREKGVYESEFVKTPFLLGLVRPCVYLPFGMDEGSLKYVIAHERSHLKHADHLFKAIGFLTLSLHWFNPLCWLAYAIFCRDLELACDERVIREFDPNERASYSQALLDFSVSRRSIGACPLAFGEGDAKKRVKAVLNYKRPVVKVVVWALVLAALLAVFASCKGNTFFGDYFAGKSMRDKVKAFGLPADESYAEAFYCEFAGDRYPKLSNSLAALEKDRGVHLCRILAIADGNCFFTAYREDDPGTLVLCSMTTEGADHKEIASTVPDGAAADVDGYGDSFHSSGGAFDYSSFKAYYYRGGIVLNGREGIVYEYDLKTGTVKEVPSEGYEYPTADSTIEWIEDRCIIKGEGACELTKDEIVEGCPEMKQLYELAKEEGHERAESDFFCGYCCCDGKAFIVTRPMSRYGFSFGALFRFEPETKRFKFVNIIYTDGFPYVYPVLVVEAKALETVGTPLPTASPGLVFADPAFEAEVRRELDKAEGEIITAKDAARCPILNIDCSGVKSLEDITAFSSLMVLRLTHAAGLDLSPVCGLRELNSLTVDKSELTDLSFVSGLTRLKELDISDNRITDLSPLAGLEKLEKFYAENNFISDIEPLFGLGKLYSVNIAWNPADSGRVEALREALSTHVDPEGDEASVYFYPFDRDNIAVWPMDLDGDGENEYFCADLYWLDVDFVSYAWLEDKDHHRIGNTMNCGTGHVAFGTYALVNSPEYGPCIMRLEPEFYGEEYGYSLMKPEGGELVTVYREMFYNYDDEGENSFDPAEAAEYQKRVRGLMESGYMLITTDRYGVIKGRLREVDPSLPGGERPVEVPEHNALAVICAKGLTGPALGRLRSSENAESFVIVEGLLRYDIEVEPYTGAE